MDFWTRLVGGAGRQGKQASPKKANPHERLGRFRELWKSIHQACNRPQSLTQPGPPVEQLVARLGQLTAILREELRAPAPYTCLAFAAEQRIYEVIGRVATVCKDDNIRLEAVTLLGVLMDSEMEGFVTNRSFARTLMRFSMRLLDSGSGRIAHETESQLIEVLFGVAAKIRMDPDILEVWFSPSSRAERDDASGSGKKTFAGFTQKDEFPLCYLFIDRVHHEGRVGDFARTGLLYIFEAASRSDALDQWIVASDLPTLMASALGALYSQLSRELSLTREPQDLPIVMALSDYSDRKHDSEVETISSESFKAHMSTFLSDLTFWQDILDHCRSVDVKQTLLDHFQVLFLQQLLYPSLLESSDTDGGSSVAVLTYLSSILQTLTDEDLTDMLLTYLLGTQAKPSDSPPSPQVERQRSSLMLLAQPAYAEEQLEPSLFNLVDLIHNGLQSRNSETVFAALKLFTVILTLQPSHAIGPLIKREQSLSSIPERTVGALETETQAYIQVANSLVSADELDDAFSSISVDVRKNLDAIAFRQTQLGHNIDSRNNSAILLEIPSAVPQSLLDLHDTGMRAILHLVESFLSNSVETNLALTETVSAICSSVRLDISGLVAIRPDKDGLSTEVTTDINLDSSWLDPEELASLRALQVVIRTPTMDDSNTPALLLALRDIATQIAHLRQSLSRFDALISKRKSILQTPQHADAFFSTPAKSRTKLQVSTPSQSISRHNSPAPLSPRRIKHNRNGSLDTPTRPLSPAGSLPRGRLGFSPSTPILSPPNMSSTPPPRGTAAAMRSPTRTPLSASVFRPPPPDSPPRIAPVPRPTTPEPDAGLHDAETLALRVRFRGGKVLSISRDGSAAGSRARSPAEPETSRASSGGETERETEVSVSHVLTNTVVLQNWILELVAILQQRARVYEGEVRFH